MRCSAMRSFTSSFFFNDTATTEIYTLSLHDALPISPRFAECLKPALAILPFAEYAAGKCQGMLISAVDNEELRNGYLAQMLDETRHVQQEIYLGRYYMKHYHDPAGFDIGQKGFGTH